jgi:hypothetical protein
VIPVTERKAKAESLRVRIVEGATLRHEGRTYHAGAELVLGAGDARALCVAGITRMADAPAKEGDHPKAGRRRGSRSAT